MADGLRKDGESMRRPREIIETADVRTILFLARDDCDGEIMLQSSDATVCGLHPPGRAGTRWYFHLAGVPFHLYEEKDLMDWVRRHAALFFPASEQPRTMPDGWDAVRKLVEAAGGTLIDPSPDNRRCRISWGTALEIVKAAGGDLPRLKKKEEPQPDGAISFRRFSRLMMTLGPDGQFSLIHGADGIAAGPQTFGPDIYGVENVPPETDLMELLAMVNERGTELYPPGRYTRQFGELSVLTAEAMA